MIIKRFTVLTLGIFTMAALFGQTARQVLDKTSEVLSNESGITCKFSITNSPLGNTSGTLDVKGSKFKVSVPQAILWFDGSTQYTYMKQQEEVNISSPSSSQLQAINPINFINMYKEGYKYSLTTTNVNYIVTLTSTVASRSLEEMVLTISKSTYVPSQIVMKQRGKSITINISDFKKANHSDTLFKFNSKDYPGVEVIDLR